ncbi:NAD-dependent epimerase/dehydratase family protein [Tengunoibacter tsumagoiensis]|uniref:Putative UDP-glucose epimerase YtcB n=1 Tax=Tengunoibacter tsumagoiensis TaxID=2014871 RepID=A0A402A777_9CHLR|nr:NAD-dependent epimerase/dehydratase family protein [Tengunoibacter tsumagoiensis]GCE14949.1 putative UDP-glucose epimerase YtcB [Tengunoibacter tsumagoiensis]
MKCIVTGVAGFIGSSIAEKLLQEGHEVIGIDMYNDFYPRIFKESNIQVLKEYSRFHLVEADLNTCVLDDLLYGSDWIFHLAAQAGVRKSWGQDFQSYLTNNVAVTQRLLEAALHIPSLKRFVYASSSSVYGNTATLPIAETAPTHPLSPYGVTKLAAEHLCSLYWHVHRVPTVSLRYFTVYGPRQRPDMGLFRMSMALLYDQPLSIYGDGLQTRDFTYIDDIVAANILAATTPNIEGNVLNIGSGFPVTLREAIEVIERQFNKKALLHYYPQAPGDMRDTSADISLASRLLGYHPGTSLEDGIAAECDFIYHIMKIKKLHNRVFEYIR